MRYLALAVFLALAYPLIITSLPHWAQLWDANAQPGLTWFIIACCLFVSAIAAYSTRQRR